jgi:general secretion pathway protein D
VFPGGPKRVGASVDKQPLQGEVKIDLMNKHLIRNLVAFCCACLLTSCTTLSVQEETRIVDDDAIQTDRKPQAVPGTAQQVTPSFANEPVSQKLEPQTTINRGTGVFVRSHAARDDISAPYVINLISQLQPYDVDNLPRHDAFLSHSTYVVPYEKDGKTWYRLRLGFFKTRAAASAVLEELEVYFPGAWVTEASFDERKLPADAVVSGPASTLEETIAEEGDVTLNFEEASLREFIRVVFEEILKQNYLIDPQVKGTVTLHTTYPVTQDAVLPIVESVLQQNGAAVVFQEGIYKVIPLADAPSHVDSPVVGKQPSARSSGYVVQIVPLRYVAASEIEKIITPFVPKGSSVSLDEARNLLILSGPKYRIDQIMETVEIFDVDWLKGMSFGLFRLQYAEAATLVGELETLVGTEGKTPLSGIVRLMPIERLNAILVISHTPGYLDEISKLIDQFDWGIEGAQGQRLYVYHLKNSKAEKLAGVLQQIYGLGSEPEQAAPTARITQLPPGEGSNVFQTAEGVSSPPPPLLSGTGAGGGYPKVAPLTGPEAGMMQSAEMPDSMQANLSVESFTNIIADQDNNALLVMASPQDYRGIESVIRQLDVPPRQVLIDATIVEVTLSNSLDYGVRWFLSDNNFNIGFNAPPPTIASGDGLALAIFSNDGDARLFIDLLAAETGVKFLSAPQVMVLDNQTANIRVGDQIPVTVRSSQSNANPDAPIVTEVQFRDTGTLLSVTPRINAGGQVTMNISQEVSLPGSEPAVGGGGNVAISQRTIDSSVIVQSGETVVLGGLILESHNDGRSGIPLLMDIPWLGNLFSTTSEDVFRTELIVMITPQVVENANDSKAIADELRIKMKNALDYGNSVEAIDL